MPLVIEYRPIVLPAEAAGEVVRAADTSGATPARTGKRLGHVRRSAIAAGIAMVALASGMRWDHGLLRPQEAHASIPTLQPFEQPGENFPGSAFYYLDSRSGVVAGSATAGTPAATGADARPLDARLGDAVARPMFLAGSAEDRFRALHCLTSAIYYEAASEPDAGQRAVAQVVLNRVRNPQWPGSVCGVVFQGSERPGCQFTFACDGSMARVPVRMWWNRAQAVAARALAGEVYAPVGLATYYHTGAVHPVWADRMSFVGAIGAHLFYRPPGASGSPAAFSHTYWGGEPTPGPHAPVVAP